MSPILRVIIIALVGTSLVVGWHYYLWARLVRDTQLARPWRKVSTAVIIALGAALPAALPISRSLPGGSFRLVYLFAYGWMGMAFLLLITLLLTDVLRLHVVLAEKLFSRRLFDPKRRQAVSRLLGGAAAVFAGGCTGVGVASALGPLQIVRLRVALPNLPPQLQGTTLVQLTDLHIGPTIERPYVDKVVSAVRQLAPDIIAVTGDLVDGTVEQLREHVAPLGTLRARHGVFFVTGNHEYYSGVAAWLPELSRLGMRVLRNERVRIGTEDEYFELAGVDDWNAAGMAPGHRHDVPGALAGRDPSREVILLAHQPRTVREASAHGVGLQLSGHTHGGQIVPWNLAVRLQQPYVSGMHVVGRTVLYVSSGTGYWGPPVRVGAPPEVTLIELVRGNPEDSRVLA